MESTSDSSIKSDVEQKESLAGSSKDEEVLLNEEFAKLQLTMKGAVVYMDKLLEENNYITPEPSSTISYESMLIGEEMYHNTVQMMAEKKLIIDEELIATHEADKNNLFRQLEDNDSEDSDEYHPDEKKAKQVEYIPLDYKVTVINIAKQHPNWSLKNLQRKGCSRLKNMKDLKRWEEQIKKGGTIIDKYTTIDSWTYDRFVEARENLQQVTTRNLQQWALAAASQFENFNFKSSLSWVNKFKRNHRIRQRKITRYVSERETFTMSEILASAEEFRIQVRHIIPNFQKEFVINTDQTGNFKKLNFTNCKYLKIVYMQYYIFSSLFTLYINFLQYIFYYITGCQYQSTFDRSLAEQGSKTVFVKKQHLNRTTHSYTAQYAITIVRRIDSSSICVLTRIDR